MTCKCGINSKLPALQYTKPLTKSNSKWLIVRNYPDPVDCIANKSFCNASDSGKLIRQVLQSHGIDLDQFAVHYLACHHPGYNIAGNDLPLSKEQVLLSTESLVERIKDTIPDRILLLGVESVNALFGYGKRKDGQILEDYRGIYTEFEIAADYKIPVYTTFEPRQLLQAPTAFFDDFNGDIFRIDQQGYLPQPAFKIITNAVETGEALRALAFGCEDLDDGVRAFDIETTALDFHQDSKDQIVSLSLCANPEQVYIWTAEALKIKSVRKALQSYFDDARIEIVGHNSIAFDCPFVYWKLGINVPCFYDIMIFHYCLDERRRSHSLKRLGLRYFGIPNWEKGIIAAKEKQKFEGKEVNYGDIEQSALFGYQAYDTAVTLLLYRRFIPEIQKDFWKLYSDILYPAARLLENIRTRGIKVNVPYLKNLGYDWDTELTVLNAKLRNILNAHGYGDLNLNSTQQLSNFLHEELKLPKINAKTVAKTGAAKMVDKYDSTCEAVLVALEPKDKSGFITGLLSYRRLAGLKSKYVDGILKLLSPEGLIYPNLLIHGTETGRLSCTKPNLMAVPKESKPLMGKDGLIPYAEQIRHAFIPRKGFKIVTSDYSQIELRMLAWLSNDDAMIEAFKSGIDFHLATAFIAFGHTEDKEKQKVIRKKAKTVNFALVYRMGIKSLAAALGVSLAEAAKTRTSILDAYKKLDSYMNNEIKISADRGYTESLFGRRRRFPLVPTSKYKALFERLSVNHPAQSSASDYCLQAAIEIFNTFNEDEVNVLLLIHDDIVLEVNENRLEELTAKIVAIQEKHRLRDKGLIFKVDPDIMSAWAELPKVKVKVEPKVSDYEDILSIIEQIEDDVDVEIEVSLQEAYGS